MTNNISMMVYLYSQYLYAFI